MNDSVSVPKDRMTPKERMAAFAAGLPYDRTPCAPFLGQNASKLFGSSNRAFNTSPKAMADVLERIFRTFRPDAVTVNAGLQSVPEALGTRLRFAEFGPPVIDEPGLSDYSEIDRLEELDVVREARMPDFFEAFEDLRERIGDEVVVGMSLGGPFTAAALLVGMDRFMRDTANDPESVDRVLDLATGAVKRFIDRAAEIGAPVSLAEPMASCTVIGPRTFRSFAKPRLAEIARHLGEVHGRGLGLHVCGKTRKIWADLAEVPLASFSLDNIESLAEARLAVGGAMTLVGNVAPIEVLKDGSPEDVLASSRACLEAAGGSPKGFILASGCEVLVDTPAGNILAMMDAARLYGQR